jgi:SAM-dependent methyltransferase
MNPEEYEILARVERDHWFYRGKRRIAREWVRRVLSGNRDQRLVDVGCGTGCFVQEMIQRGYSMVGIDDHRESVERAQVLLGEKNFREGSAERFPFEAGSVDVVTLLDVLEHLKDDRLALKSLYEGLKPGGYLILTVPAFDFFWSDWDRSLHHYRRYTPGDLLPRLREAGFEISFWNFINVLAFPVVYLLRQWREFGGGSENPLDRPENRIPWGPLNKVLEWQFVAMAVQKWVKFPLGVSLLVVARKIP